VYSADLFEVTADGIHWYDYEKVQQYHISDTVECKT